MPRAFSKSEQDTIRKKIIEKGKELFYSSEYRTVPVSEITKQVGIASGSFYQFFKSKEELFMEIYFEENRVVVENILKSTDLKKDPREVIKDVFFKLNEEVRKSTLMGRLHDNYEFIQISGRMSAKMKGSIREQSYKPFIPLIVRWQEEGRIKKIKPEMILTLFDSVFYVKMHKDDLGEKYFPDLLEYLFEFILNGISKGD